MQSVTAAPPQNPANSSGAHAVVVLETPADGEHACQKLMTRELIRQAFLLTAREEFRAATRDGVLREQSDGKSPDVRMFRMQVDLLQFTHVKIRLEAAGNTSPTDPWTGEFKDGGEKQLETALALADGWSQREFVEWLKSAKLPTMAVPNQKPEIDLTAPVPLDFVSQIEMLRRLHAALPHDPRSPAFNARLAQHYAVLGSLTEPHWGSEHKVFKARALLYAQRAVRFGPTDANAAWIKSLAFALCGRHDLAEKEMERARSLSTAETTPAWADALHAFATWDLAGLTKSVESKQPLSAYLNMRAAEMGGTEIYRFQACQKVIGISPECLRVMVTLSSDQQLGLRREVGMQQFQQFLTFFPHQVSQLPGISTDLRDAARDVDYLKSPDTAIDKTVSLVQALNRAGATTDRQEPSLSVLATLATNLHFVHALRILVNEEILVSSDMTSGRKVFERLLKPHPARDFVNVIQADLHERQHAYIEAAPALLKLPVNDASWPIIRWLTSMRVPNVQGALEDRIRSERDDIVPDLLAKLYDNLSEGELHGAMGVLERLSPGCPGLILARINHDWKNFQSKAPAWLEQSSNGLILEALGGRYERTADENPDDQRAALRCWKKLVEVEPSYNGYWQLANHYKRFDMDEEWKQALLKSLELPTLGLNDAVVNRNLAEWYMDRQEWQEALPFALAAADSYSAWGLLCASRCMEGLEEWDQAEEFAGMVSERYEAQWIEWYLWCQRTGRGNLGSAKKLCQTAIARLNDNQRRSSQILGIYYHLEGELSKAANFYQRFSEGNDPSGYWAIHAMLLLDQLGNAKDRDRVIEAMNEKGPPFAVLFSHQLIRSLDRSAPPLSQADLEFCYGYGAAFDDATNAAYFIGKLLLQRNQKDDAIVWLQRAATSPVINKWSCALAAAELRRLGAKIPPMRMTDFDEPLFAALKLTIKGLKYRNNDRLELATRTMDDAIASSPDWTVALFCKANVIKRTGQQKAAEELFTNVLRQVPRQPFVLGLRGQVREELNDKPGAIADYEAALKIVPAYTFGKTRLNELKNSGEKAK